MRFCAFERLCQRYHIWDQCGRTPVHKFELNGIHAWFYWRAHSLVHTRARPLQRSRYVPLAYRLERILRYIISAQSALLRPRAAYARRAVRHAAVATHAYMLAADDVGCFTSLKYKYKYKYKIYL
jgi:hypothetical protein